MKAITNYHKACHGVAKAFIKKYYPKSQYCDDWDSWWVGDEPGGVFYINDKFFDITLMVQALELDATESQLHDYYDAELEAAIKEPSENLDVNFRNYVKYGMELK